MKIRNTIIITCKDSEISTVGFDDPSEFSGNIILPRDALPPSLVAQIDAAIGKLSTPNNAATPEIHRREIDAEFVG